MVQPTSDGNGNHLIRRVSRRCRKHRRRRNPLLKPLMRSGLIVVYNIGASGGVGVASPATSANDPDILVSRLRGSVRKRHSRGARSIRRSKHFDATCERHSCNMLSELAISISHEILWCLSIWSCFPQLLRDPGISGSACHIHMDHLPRRAVRRGRRQRAGGRRDRSPAGNHRPHPRHLCHMIAQECFSRLSTRSFSGSLFHLPLNSSFTYTNIQLKRLTPNALRSEDDGCLFPFP